MLQPVRFKALIGSRQIEIITIQVLYTTLDLGEKRRMIDPPPTFFLLDYPVEMTWPGAATTNLTSFSFDLDYLST